MKRTCQNRSKTSRCVAAFDQDFVAVRNFNLDTSTDDGDGGKHIHNVFRAPGELEMALTSDEIPTRFLPRMGLFLARFSTSAWIGAATLFVVVGVTEVTRGGFDSTTKDLLVTVRFPAFYVCGAVLVGVGWLGVWIAGNSALLPANRRIGALVLLSVVLAVMAVDYVWIYLPLLQMVTPPGQAKPGHFRNYHEASKWINLVGLFLCLIASSIVNWPATSSRERELDSPNENLER